MILGWNQINGIDSNGFQGLESLVELNLERNQLTKIKSDSFQHLKTLKKLDLCNKASTPGIISTKTPNSAFVIIFALS